ncbi:MAG: aldehyde dehydrogenase family protein, partial [Phycisphaeraceae bacterium]|nr:aldehyde dehydrogenase family protein [Phycisphaeraceae bacterium]
MRRLLENTSNESWLRGGLDTETPVDALIKSPHDEASDLSTEPAPTSDPQRHNLSPAHPDLGDGRPFLNEPTRDFARETVRQDFAGALEKITLDPPAITDDPSDATAALDQICAGADPWAATDGLGRARIIDEAADRLADQRDALAGLIIREAGKPWREADADVCEAIDFCRFYARHSLSLTSSRRLGRFTGELDQLTHIPRGPTAVISPWNFPLAITTGMTVAALVTGNPVVVKPAEQTPAIAAELVKVLHAAGVPESALALVVGDGPNVGAALVDDPRMATIAFTGSREVGLSILETAGKVPDGQDHVKQVICEMGGKNAIIVDASADLDQAVAGVRDSAFGYAGQKCSACSRVIVHTDIYDVFLDRLVGASEALAVGDPRDPATDVGPVIDDDAAEKIHCYLEIAHHEGQPALVM